MKCKLRLALVGYLLARSWLPTSWGCLLSQLGWSWKLGLAAAWNLLARGWGGWMKCKIRLKLSQLGCSWQLGLLLGLS